MSRGGGGGGFHSSFGHSSFGGSHSSYHHSSSSSSSSYHHSSNNITNHATNIIHNNITPTYTTVTTTEDIYIPTTHNRSNESIDNYIQESVTNYKLDNYINQLERYRNRKDRAIKDIKESKNKKVFRYRYFLYALSIICILLTIGSLYKAISIYTSTYTCEVIDNFNKLNTEQCIYVDDWYTDNWHTWIYDKDTLLKGLINFYEVTGSQPYLYITGEEGINYSSEELVRNLAEDIYKSKFNDSGHTILVFREYPDSSGDWYADVFVGNTAVNMLGEDVADVIMKYVVKYYDYSYLSDEEMFSRAFSDAAKEIHDRAIIKNEYVDNTYILYIISMLIFGAGIVTGVVLSFDAHETKSHIASTENDLVQYDTIINNTIKHIENIEKEAISTETCPNCGASIDINIFGKGTCTYCGKTLQLESSYSNYDIESIKNSIS